MLPGEQAKAMVDAWRQSTQNMWESWVGAFTPPAAPRSASALDEWSEAAVQGLRTLVDQAVPVAGSFVERLLPDPQPLTSLFEASVAAWQAIGRQAPVPQGPQDLFGVFTHQPVNPFRLTELGGAAQDLGELWTQYQEALQKLCRPWIEALARSGPAEAPVHDADHHSGLVRFSELSWDMFERTFGRLLQSPSIGFTRELNEKLLGAFSAWLDFRRASADYQTALSAALTRSMTKFLQELASLAGKGESIGGLRDLLRLWGDTLDGVLIESFRSEEYAKVQGRIVRAAMAYRIREREAMDVLLKIGHVPTRRDVDEVARHLYELRKEVREVAKAPPERAAAASGPAQASRAPSERAPVRPTAGTGTKPAEARADIGRTGAKPASSEAKTGPSSAGSEAKTEAKAGPSSAGSEAKTEAKAGPSSAGSEAKTEAKPAVPEAKPGTKPQTSEAKADVKKSSTGPAAPAAKAGARPASPEAKTEPASEAKTEAKREAKAKPGATESQRPVTESARDDRPPAGRGKGQS